MTMLSTNAASDPTHIPVVEGNRYPGTAAMPVPIAMTAVLVTVPS